MGSGGEQRGLALRPSCGTEPGPPSPALRGCPRAGHCAPEKGGAALGAPAERGQPRSALSAAQPRGEGPSSSALLRGGAQRRVRALNREAGEAKLPLLLQPPVELPVCSAARSKGLFNLPSGKVGLY